MENNEKNLDIADNDSEKEPIAVDTFLSSLDSLDSENEEVSDNNTEETQKKKKRGKEFWIWASVLGVCITVFIVSIVMIALNVYEGNTSDKINNELNADFFGDSDRTDLMSYLSPMVLDNTLPKYGASRKNVSDLDYQIINTNSPLLAQFKEKLTEYQKINSDIYGWIQVDGTDISYAIVRGNDNSYYLNHTVTKEYNENGSIFADFRCEDNILDNANFVLYGHNSTYLSQMFSQLHKFVDKSFFEQNRYITIYTVDGIYRYEIFSVYETYSTYTYSMMNFVSDMSFVKWCREMKSNSLHEREMPAFKPTSRIITLSTCTNGYYTRRYSVQGRLVTIER